MERDMANPYVFIVGCPRSGTTLLRRMVDAHPQIAIIPEIGWLASRYELRQGLTDAGMLTTAFLESLPKKGGFGRYTPLPIPRQEIESRLASTPLSYADFIRWLFDRYGQDRGKAFVGNKTVDHVLSIGTLHSLWPQAKFVHLIRDGRDVCLSVLAWRRAPKLASRFTTWNEEPVTTAALWWEWHVRRGREAGKSLGPALYYEMRYESFVQQPAEECAALAAFLGVPYDEAMVRFHERREDRKPGPDAKHAWLPATPGLRDWRTQMPADQVQRFEAATHDLLDELVYPRSSGHVPRESLERAHDLRLQFEGQPLPQYWQA